MKKVKLIDILPEMTKRLENGEEFSFLPNGISMLPTIVGGRDNVTVKKPNGKLKKNDIILYRRATGQFVLHRIVKVGENGYTLRGDNEVMNEKNITDDKIIGVVVRYRQNGVFIEAESKKFQRDANVRHLSFPFRRALSDFKNKIVHPILYGRK